jgi:hypothetical protein
MRKLFIRTAALSAFAALGIAASMPAPAGAEGLYLGARFGVDAAGGHAYRDGWRLRPWQRRHDLAPREFRQPNLRRDEWGRESCSPRRALFKAERLGLRRVFLRNVGRSTIRVSGRRHGDRVTVTFARAPSCPVVGF